MMELKKFEAPTLAEALQVIKRELGPEAIVLSTKTKKSGFGLLNKASVEVTATVSADALDRKRSAELVLSEEQKHRIQTTSSKRAAQAYDILSGARASRQMSAASTTFTQQGSNYGALNQKSVARSASPMTQRRYVDIQDDESPAEVATLRQGDRAEFKSTENQRVQNYNRQTNSSFTQQGFSQAQVNGGVKSRQLPQGLAAVLADLIEAGVEEDLVREFGDELKVVMLRDQLSKTEHLRLQMARILMARFRVARPLTERLMVPGTPRIISFVGPTGVGKTTTIAKIAAELVLNQKRPVTLATSDTYKIAAVEQLQTYANILKIPLEVCPNVESLDRLNMSVGPEEVILLDTGGFAPKDESKIAELNDLLSGVRAEVHLCLSATTRDRDLMNAVRRFKSFNPNYVVLTKIDESSSYGNLLNVAVKSGIPLSYLTMGQRVPEDIEVATKERVVDLVMHLSGGENSGSGR